MSFEALINRISAKLNGIVFKIHGSYLSVSKEDLYQEAVLQLWVDYNNGKLSDKTDSYYGEQKVPYTDAYFTCSS